MDAYNSLAVLHFLLRIFSLHCISSNKQGFISDPWPNIKVNMMLFIFGFLMSYNLHLHYSSDMLSSISPSVVVVDTIDCIVCYFAFIIDLYFVFKYRSDMCAFYYNFDQIDSVLNVKYNKHVKTSVITLVSIFLPSWLVASIGQYSVWISPGNLLSSTTYAISYFTFLIRLLTVLDFISQTMHLQYRLKSISEHIDEIAILTDDSLDRVKIIRQTVKDNKLMPLISKCRCKIPKTSSCFLLLIKQASFLNRFFGIRMLIHCLYTLIEMITFVNFAARVISGAMGAGLKSYMLLAPYILKFINCVALLCSIVYYSEACSRGCGDIVDAVDRFLVNKRTSDDKRQSLKTLRKLVNSRPLKFSAAGFFNLESTLLLSIASVVITYALVLVQSTQ